MQKQTSVTPIQGVNFLTDSKGNRKAVVIDLDQYGDLLEEFFDVVISRQRMEEDEKISLADFKQSLIDEERLSADV